VEDGVEDFVVPPADKDGEGLDVDARAGGLDLLERLFQSGEATGGVPDGEVFWATWTGDDGLDGGQGPVVVGQVWECRVGQAEPGEVVSDAQIGDAGTLEQKVGKGVDEVVVRIRDVGLPGFLGGELDVDGVDVGGREGRAVARGREEVGRGRGHGVGLEGGDAGGQHDDEARGPAVGGCGDGGVAKVLVDVAGPVEADETELLALCKGAELAGVAAAAEAQDGELGDGEVAGVAGGGAGAEGRGAVLDGELIEGGEAVDEVVEGVGEDHAVEGEVAEVGECECVGVHGVGDVVRGKEVDGACDADVVEDAGFVCAAGSVYDGDVAGEVHDGPRAADLLDAVELCGRGGHGEGERAHDGTKRRVLEEEGVVRDEAEGVCPAHVSVEDPHAERPEAPVRAHDGGEVGRGVELLEDVDPQLVGHHRGSCSGCGCVAWLPSCDHARLCADSPRATTSTHPSTPSAPLPQPPPSSSRVHPPPSRGSWPSSTSATSVHPPPADPAHRPQTTEFAARMRTWVPHAMPLLTAKIYRRDAAAPRQTPTAFDHDAAERRLADAFDGGGFDAWAEVAVSELEAEVEVERARKRTG
jgi:hypothetical protein